MAEVETREARTYEEARRLLLQLACTRMTPYQSCGKVLGPIFMVFIETGYLEFLDRDSTPHDAMSTILEEMEPNDKQRAWILELWNQEIVSIDHLPREEVNLTDAPPSSGKHMIDELRGRLSHLTYANEGSVA